MCCKQFAPELAFRNILCSPVLYPIDERQSEEYGRASIERKSCSLSRGLKRTQVLFEMAFMALRINSPSSSAIYKKLRHLEKIWCFYYGIVKTYQSKETFGKAPKHPAILNHFWTNDQLLLSADKEVLVRSNLVQVE